MKESIMSHLQVEEILVVSEEEETSPLFSSPRTTRHVEVRFISAWYFSRVKERESAQDWTSK